MDWIILDKESAQALKNRKVYCFGLSKQYIDEVVKVGLSDRIEAIIEADGRKEKAFMLAEKEIPLLSASSIASIDLSESSIVVTSSFVKDIEIILEKKNIASQVYRVLLEEDIIELNYKERYRYDPLEDIIVFRSGPMEFVMGADFFDNARALFEYMLVNEYNKKYRLVWFVKDPDKIPREYLVYNVEFVSYDWFANDDEKGTEKYFYDLFHAKYIFTTDTYGFMRNVRKEAKRVQLWHGCGFKTRVNFTSCENKYDYMTVISELYAKIHEDIYGLRKNQLLVTGYPKQDWLFQPYPNGIVDLLKVKETKKCIFWLPTFRKSQSHITNLKRTEYELNSETGLPILNTMEQVKELNCLLQQMDVMMIIKSHYLQGEKYCQSESYSNVFILEHDEMAKQDLILNRLLASADALISDYSSVAVDYMVLNRPIAFTLDDVEEYQNHRGFIFDNIADWLPGMKIFNFEDFIDFVREVADGIDSSREIRERLLSEMHAYADNKNSLRVLEALGISK